MDKVLLVITLREIGLDDSIVIQRVITRAK